MNAEQKKNPKRILADSVSGRKDDQGKLRFSLLPWKSLEKVVEVLEYGARKYSIDNWQKVENGAERYKEATLRHLVARLQGEILDSGPGGSGLPHLHHAAASILFWMWFEIRDGAK